MIWPGNWTQQIDTARLAAAAIQAAKPDKPVNLKKTYRQGDVIYTAMFKPPAVPRFGNNNHTGE